jgi:hypothetical protein
METSEQDSAVDEALQVFQRLAEACPFTSEVQSLVFLC